MSRQAEERRGAPSRRCSRSAPTATPRSSSRRRSSCYGRSCRPQTPGRPHRRAS